MTKQKIAVLTGVTSGIGREVALGLVKLGYQLLIIARSEKRFELLKQDALAIDQLAILRFYQADLSLVESTTAALARIRKEATSIDLIYQSAGLIPGKIELTKEGVEKTFAVSYLTRYVVLKELVPLLMQSDEKMVLNMAGAGQKGKIYFEDINFQRMKFSPIKVVKQFQQANDALMLDLQREHSKGGIKVYCLRPGLVDTGIHEGWPNFLGFFIRHVFGALFMVPAQRAAKIPLSIVQETLRPEGVLVNEKGNAMKPSKILSSTDYQNKVVRMSEKLLKLRFSKSD